MQSITSGHGLSLGLRWLDVDAAHLPGVKARDWRGFLVEGESLPEPRRLWLLRLWPLLALINGPLALSGLMLWPQRSGVHLLLFLMVFVLMPLVLMLWAATNGLVLGRTPWWRPLITAHRDRVVALWCARQSILLQGLFCIAGLAWLWLALLTRQVIFYWGTSINPVSERVAGWFEFLSVGLLNAPGVDAIQAAEAGAITGWQGALLADSMTWASWLTQVVALWVLLPWVVLLLVCQRQLQTGIAQWPRHNHRLRQLYEQACAPQVTYRALQPEQPLVEPAGHRYPLLDRQPTAPGFVWRLSEADSGIPCGSVALGEGQHATDEATVRARGAALSYWYIAGHAVPTGDLADLLQLHCESGGEPTLRILLTNSDLVEKRLDALRHSWGVFLERNGLDLVVELVRQQRDRE